MKTVCKENLCSGCRACVDICARHAITIKDSFENYNAVIQEDKCVRCNSCIKVCPQQTRKKLNPPISWYQGWAKDSDIRSKSSSGGIASAIEKAFVRNGGIVCSCLFNNGEFIFKSVDNESAISQFAGSKYVKSNPVGIYNEIDRILKQDRRVLFIGLPCQVSALKNYIHDSYQDSLYTIDLICHGTPSPELLKMYLQQYKLELEKIKTISFRMKDRFQLCIEFKPVEGVIGICDHYSIAFLNSVCYTYNCYHCAYATINRIGDITLGDSWGTDLDEIQAKAGISLILCQNKKGMALLKDKSIHLKPVDIENSIRNNHQLREPVSEPASRQLFFTELKKGKKFNAIICHCFPWICFKQFIKKILLERKILRRDRI